MIDTLTRHVIATNRDGGRRDRLFRYRMRQIRAELEARADGETILEGFAAAGPVPA